MALLLSCHNISKVFGSHSLFEGISLTISEGDRIGLIGPNGSGKSTLLGILAGDLPADDGIIAPRKLLRLGYVAQEDSFDAGRSVRQIMDDVHLAQDLTEAERSARTNAVLGRAGFTETSIQADALSGGWRKRLAVARELLKEPDLLLLDEPTNHLDLDGILWLERLLKAASFASLVVSHDRYFLEAAATVMMEINRLYPDGLFRVDGNYSGFLEKKEQFLHAQAKHQEALENKVRREVEWLRRGAKARTTKSKARIDAAEELMAELSEVSSRTATRSTQIDFSGTGRRTKRLIEAEHIAKGLGGRELFHNVSFVLAPGTRLGLLGPNGSGKTTLLRILAGEIEPDGGAVKRADGVRLLYFDQKREQLDPLVTLRRALAPEGDSVLYGDRAIHINGWAARFQFRAEQLELPVGRLSGGEQARVVIARLILQPADVLLLDEPTNDLDIPTLETLEDSLLDFPGAIVLVTHDRYMLDRVSTVIAGLDGKGAAAAFADCEQWERWRESREAGEQGVKESRSQGVRDSGSRGGGESGSQGVRESGSPDRKPRKLSYIENREYERIEGLIAEADGRLRRAREEMQNPEASHDAGVVQGRYDELLAAQAEVDRLYERWAELESKVAE
jgi:ATP-binding cassette subfamily F protein uup